MNSWKGKAYVLFILTLSVSGHILAAEMQEMQLAQDLKMQYKELQQKGDNSKREYFITDPHFIWLDSSEKPPVTKEADHKGTLHVILDFKGNQIQAESIGSTRLFINNKDKVKSIEEKASTAASDPSIAQKGEGQSEGKADQTAAARSYKNDLELVIEGKIVKDISIDFAKAENPVAQIRSGTFNIETLISLLESIKSTSMQGVDVKVSGTDITPTLYEKFAFDYKHTSGATPEELVLKVSGSQASQSFFTYYEVNFPSAGPALQSADLSLSLPAWRKLYEMSQSGVEGYFPEGAFNFKFLTKSKIWELNTSGFLTSKQQDNLPIFDNHFTFESNLSPNWIDLLQDVEITLTDRGQEQASRKKENLNGLRQWLTASSTKEFLALLPLKTTIDISSTGKGTASGSINSVIGKFSWLSNQKGLIINVNYENQLINSQFTIAGGKGLLDYGVTVYNALVEALPKEGLKKFSPKAREDFINLLTSYAMQPDKAQAELKYAVKQDENGFNIGDKSIFNFISDFSQFKEKHFSTEAGNY